MEELPLGQGTPKQLPLFNSIQHMARAHSLTYSVTCNVMVNTRGICGNFVIIVRQCTMTSVTCVTSLTSVTSVTSVTCLIHAAVGGPASLTPPALRPLLEALAGRLADAFCTTPAAQGLVVLLRRHPVDGAGAQLVAAQLFAQGPTGLPVNTRRQMLTLVQVPPPSSGHVCGVLPQRSR